MEYKSTISPDEVKDISKEYEDSMQIMEEFAQDIANNIENLADSLRLTGKKRHDFVIDIVDHCMKNICNTDLDIDHNIKTGDIFIDKDTNINMVCIFCMNRPGGNVEYCGFALSTLSIHNSIVPHSQLFVVKEATEESIQAVELCSNLIKIVNVIVDDIVKD